MGTREGGAISGGYRLAGKFDMGEKIKRRYV
jgi:hypothetical protein